MCKEYVNIQTGEKLDLERVTSLPDNTMLKVKPESWIEWDFEKNEDVDIYKITKGVRNNISWICNKGHEWKAVVYSRIGKNRGCPYCTGQKTILGVNDMWTARPDMASMLLNPEDGYKYMSCTNVKLTWKCPTCYNIKETSGNNVAKQGICCSECNDTRSYPEKVMTALLNSLNIEYEFDKSISWSNNKRYDFYIPSLNTIIETHGKQHYSGLAFTRNRDFEAEKSNDLLKRKLAISNGIENYIEIDCRKSTFSYIKDSIIESGLLSILNIKDITINAQDVKLLDNKMHETWKLANEGYTIKYISKKLNKSEFCINQYIRKGMEIEKCNYDFDVYKKTRKKVISLHVEDGTLKLYDSVKDAAITIGLKSYSHIGLCCKHNKMSRGYKFMYYDEYIKYIEGFKS